MIYRNTIRQEIRRNTAGTVSYWLNDTASAATFTVHDGFGAELQASTAATVTDFGEIARSRVDCAIDAIDRVLEAAEVQIQITGRDPIWWPFDVVSRPYRAELVTRADLEAEQDHAPRIIEAQARLRRLSGDQYVDQIVAPIARRRMDGAVRAALRKQYGDDARFWRGSAIVDADRLVTVEINFGLAQLYRSQSDQVEDGRAAAMSSRFESEAFAALDSMGTIRLDTDADGDHDATLRATPRTWQLAVVQS